LPTQNPDEPKKEAQSEMTHARSESITIQGKGWWSAFRIYGPQAPAFDGTWKLSDLEVVK
jgi:hypothetical protein